MFIHSYFNDYHMKHFLAKNVHAAGIMATLIGIVSFLPVLFVVYKTKNTDNFPYQTLILAILSNLLWIIYAINTKPHMDKQIAFMGFLYLCIYLFILYTKTSKKQT